MSRWFRHYAGMMRDEKLVRAAVHSKQSVERVVWVWGAILESAAEINENGRYELDCGEAAYFLRCDDADVAGIVASLASIGRLAGGVVSRWSDRQFASDASAERQRRYRDRKSGAGVHERHGDNRHGDTEGDVTPPSRDGEVTPQETELETDTPFKPPKGGQTRRRPLKGNAALEDLKRKLTDEADRENQGTGSDNGNAGGVAVRRLEHQPDYG